jgi:hypothetical protein
MVPPVSLVKGARLWREESTGCRPAALGDIGMGWGWVATDMWLTRHHNRQDTDKYPLSTTVRPCPPLCPAYRPLLSLSYLFDFIILKKKKKKKKPVVDS